MKTRRILMSLSGVLIGAVSVGLFKVAALGVDPFQSLMSGLDKWIPISFGTLYVIVNLVLLIFSLLVDRSKIGLATFINLFLLGYVTEFSYAFFLTLLPDPSLPVRVICMLIGAVVMCFGSALYMTADLGVSTYDAIAIALAYKWKLASFRFCRISTDLICVVLGCGIFLLAGGAWANVQAVAGVGTILCAFGMGPLIEYFNVTVARPMLRMDKEKAA